MYCYKIIYTIVKTKLNEYIKHLEPLIELARIDNFGDFENSNIAIFIKGGEGYQTEHGEPHFTLCFDKKNNNCVRILIPDSIKWVSNKKITILDNNSVDKKTKRDLIKWLDLINTDNNKLTNLESLIFTWNILNKTNKNVRQAK